MTRLDEIEARANAATEGPWETEGGVILTVEDAPIAVAEFGGSTTDDSSDAEFIAHARQDVPALVAALRAVLDLHRPVEATRTTQGRGVETVTVCEHTMDAYPCTTVRAIHEHLGEDA